MAAHFVMSDGTQLIPPTTANPCTRSWSHIVCDEPIESELSVDWTTVVPAFEFGQQTWQSASGESEDKTLIGNAITGGRRLAIKTDLTKAPFFMAPEVKDQVGVTARADVRNLDVSTHFNFAVRDRLCTSQDMNESLLHIRKLSLNLTKICVKLGYNKRLNIVGVKYLEFYKGFNRGKMLACKMQPSHPSEELEVSATGKNFDLGHYGSHANRCCLRDARETDRSKIS
eukprot:TsM_000995100 transcript=TsM_000995100 gene=TsM_000995100